MKKNKNQAQQGDVLLKRVNNVDLSGAEEIPARNGRHILADGEVTGHAHAISEVEGVKLLRLGKKTYAQVDKKVTIKHEEHKTQTLTPGTYEFGQVMEYDYFQDMEREVKD